MERPRTRHEQTEHLAVMVDSGWTEVSQIAATRTADLRARSGASTWERLRAWPQLRLVVTGEHVGVDSLATMAATPTRPFA